MIKKLFAYVKKFIAYRRYPYLTAVVGFFDVFLFIIPEDLLIVAGAMAKPEGWKSTLLIVALGSALGAVTLAWLLQTGFGGFLGQEGGSGWWGDASAYSERLGPWALVIAASLPVPMQPFVALAVVAKLPLPKIFALAFLGRAIKYSWLTALAFYFPTKLGKKLRPNEEKPMSSKLHNR
jgi:membrane protein YqaA with SNARE-associated domain